MTTNKRRAMLGLEFAPNVLDELRLLSKKDRHSVSLLIRDAVDMYLDRRRTEIDELQEALRGVVAGQVEEILRRLRQRDCTAAVSDAAAEPGQQGGHS